MDVKGLDPDSNPAWRCRQFRPKKILGSLVIFQCDDFLDGCSRSIEEKPRRLSAEDSPAPLEPADPIGFDPRTGEQMWTGKHHSAYPRRQAAHDPARFRSNRRGHFRIC